MCLQCVSKAERLVGDVIPGYSLYIAREGCEVWPRGYYGLVRSDDPDFIWSEKPIPDPTEGLSEAEIEGMDIGEFSRFHEVCERIESDFKADPMTCYRFVEACKGAGYDPGEHGENVVMWFVGVMGKALRGKGL